MVDPHDGLDFSFKQSCEASVTAEEKPCHVLSLALLGNLRNEVRQFSLTEPRCSCTDIDDGLECHCGSGWVSRSGMVAGPMVILKAHNTGLRHVKAPQL